MSLKILISYKKIVEFYRPCATAIFDLLWMRRWSIHPDSVSEIEIFQQLFLQLTTIHFRTKIPCMSSASANTKDNFRTAERIDNNKCETCHTSGRFSTWETIIRVQLPSHGSNSFCFMVTSLNIFLFKQYFASLVRISTLVCNPMTYHITNWHKFMIVNNKIAKSVLNYL